MQDKGRFYVPQDSARPFVRSPTFVRWDFTFCRGVLSHFLQFLINNFIYAGNRELLILMHMNSLLFIYPTEYQELCRTVDPLKSLGSTSFEAFEQRWPKRWWSQGFGNAFTSPNISCIYEKIASVLQEFTKNSSCPNLEKVNIMYFHSKQWIFIEYIQNSLVFMLFELLSRVTDKASRSLLAEVNSVTSPYFCSNMRI